MDFQDAKYPLKKESYKIIGFCMNIHQILGPGMLEIVYKDAIEIELKSNNIPYEREKKFEVEYKGYILPHFFVADFVVYDKIILEVKAQKRLADEHYRWVINYLAISGCPLGLVINFGQGSLVSKRIVLTGHITDRF